MLSVDTNPQAIQARQAFAGATAAAEATRARVSTGLRIAGPQDDGAAWSIAQRLRAKVASWQTADDSLSRGQSLLDVAQAGAGQISDLLSRMREKALALQDQGLDAKSRAAVTEDLKALAAQVDKVATDAEFSGRRPLADTLTQTTVTSVASGYVIPSAPLTPPTLAGALQPAAGGRPTSPASSSPPRRRSCSRRCSTDRYGDRAQGAAKNPVSPLTRTWQGRPASCISRARRCAAAFEISRSREWPNSSPSSSTAHSPSWRTTVSTALSVLVCMLSRDSFDS